jgi:type III restriction enzyme
LVKLSDQRIFVVETKGLEDLDVPVKMERLANWCNDVDKLDKSKKYDYLFVDQDTFAKYKFSSFIKLISTFTKYK